MKRRISFVLVALGFLAALTMGVSGATDSGQQAPSSALSLPKPNVATSAADIKGSLHRTSALVEGGFYVEANKRQWLHPDCMTDLEAAGAYIHVNTWNPDNSNWTRPLANLEEASDLVACDTLLSLLANAERSTHTLEIYESSPPAEGYLGLGSVRVLDADENVVAELEGTAICYYGEGNCEVSPYYLVDTYEVLGKGDNETRLWRRRTEASWDGRFRLVYRYQDREHDRFELHSIDLVTGTTQMVAGYSSGLNPYEAPHYTEGYITGHSWAHPSFCEPYAGDCTVGGTGRNTSCSPRVFVVDLITGERACADIGVIAEDTWR